MWRWTLDDNDDYSRDNDVTIMMPINITINMTMTLTMTWKRLAFSRLRRRVVVICSWCGWNRIPPRTLASFITSDSSILRTPQTCNHFRLQMNDEEGFKCSLALFLTLIVSAAELNRNTQIKWKRIAGRRFSLKSTGKVHRCSRLGKSVTNFRGNIFWLNDLLANM